MSHKPELQPAARPEAFPRNHRADRSVSWPFCLAGLFLTGVLTGAGTAAAAESPAEATASGTFLSGRETVQIGGAYAFWAKSESPDEEPVIRLAVSNDRFQAAAFDAFSNPQPLISERFADDETRLVYFEFRQNGAYHGLSYYFGQGDGCGYCYDSSVKSSVKIEEGRLRGSLQFKDERRSFDIQVDVPVPPRDWGKPLPAGAGEIGNAYLAYQKALESRDKKAIYDLIVSSQRDRWKQREAEGKLDRHIEYRWEKEHVSLTEPRITGGFQRGDQAVLLVKGKNSYMALQGQVALSREEGQWLIRDEIYEAGE